LSHQSHGKRLHPGKHNMVIDSHTHIASPDRQCYPLDATGVGSGWFKAEDVGVTDLVALTKSCGVNRVVIVQGIGAYGYDNTYAVDAVRDHPEQLCLVGAVDMVADDPAMKLAVLGKVAGKHLRGVRLFGVGATPPAWLTDGRADAVWRQARDLGITVVPTLLAGSLSSMTGLIDRYRDVPVVVEHIGFVDLAGGAPFPHAQPLFDLAQYPAVNVKVTTHSLVTAEAVGDPADLIDRLVEVFGADRLVWGSDHPQTVRRTYPQMLELAHHASRRLRPEHRDLFLGGTAARLWWAGS
jgi:L-fuconolactonase